MDKEDDKDNEDEDDGDSEPGSVLFVKNISFDSTEESLKKVPPQIVYLSVVLI